MDARRVRLPDVELDFSKPRLQPHPQGDAVEGGAAHLTPIRDRRAVACEPRHPGARAGTAPRPEGPFRRVSGTPPEFKMIGDPRLRESSHYGLVLTLWDKVYGASFSAPGKP